MPLKNLEKIIRNYMSINEQNMPCSRRPKQRWNAASREREKPTFHPLSRGARSTVEARHSSLTARYLCADEQQSDSAKPRLSAAVTLGSDIARQNDPRELFRTAIMAQVLRRQPHFSFHLSRELLLLLRRSRSTRACLLWRWKYEYLA